MMGGGSTIYVHYFLHYKKQNPVNKLFTGFTVGMGRFELPASTSRTWRANLAALHPDGIVNSFDHRSPGPSGRR